MLADDSHAISYLIFVKIGENVPKGLGSRRGEIGPAIEMHTE